MVDWEFSQIFLTSKDYFHNIFYQHNNNAQNCSFLNQYFGHLMQTADSLEKTLMLEKIEGKRRQRLRCLDSIANSRDVNLNKLWEVVKDRGAWCAAAPGVTNIWSQFSDWKTTSIVVLQCCVSSKCRALCIAQGIIVSIL